MTTTGSGTTSSLPAIGLQVTDTSGYRTAPIGDDFHVAAERPASGAAQRCPAMQSTGSTRSSTWSSDPPGHHRDDQPSNSYRSGCSRSQARNSSSDIRFSAAFDMSRDSTLAAAVSKPTVGQPAERAGDRGDALDDGGARRGDFALLEGDDGQRRKGVEQFARAQQEIGVARPPEALVAEREGLVDQHAARRQRAARSSGNSGRCR